MAPSGCLLCAPLIAKTVAQMLDQMHIAKANGAQVVEFRVDHITDFDARFDLRTLLQSKTLPAIITYRPKWEGGEYEGDEEPRQAALSLAIELGVEFIDVELQVAAEFIPKQNRTSKTKIVVSNHNWTFTPSAEEIGNLVARIQSTGADIVKFATTATDITDVARVLQVLSRSAVPTIALVMGPKGVISRILAPKFGGYLTFGSLGSGLESAPGQPTLKKLLDVYALGRMTQDTKVYGIVGNPVGHSKGPIIHNAAFAEAGINAVYVPFLVDDFAEFLKVYTASDFAGFSVTIPHKESALRCCDEVDPLAKAIGAVNTVIRRPSDGKLVGYNTDCEGAISAIEDGLRQGNFPHNSGQSPLAGKIFVLIGAGGAGKALAFGAKERGAHVVVANRNQERAKALADAVGGQAITLDELNHFCPQTGMVLANSTSVGMHPNIMETPISKDALKAYSLVFDAVYTPRVTRLLQEASEVGAVAVSGLEMFIRQAIGQFELFTGQSAPKQLMRDIITHDDQAPLKSKV